MLGSAVLVSGVRSSSLRNDPVSPDGDVRRLRLPRDARRVAPLKRLPKLVCPKASIMEECTPDRGRTVNGTSKLGGLIVLVDSAVDIEDRARRGGPGRGVTVGGGAAASLAAESLSESGVASK
jgi:hypothetical protein